MTTKYTKIADEIDRDRETRVVDVTPNGVVIENIFTSQQTTVQSVDEALRFSRAEGQRWASK
jgi:hypothetical protein